MATTLQAARTGQRPEQLSNETYLLLRTLDNQTSEALEKHEGSAEFVPLLATAHILNHLLIYRIIERGKQLWPTDILLRFWKIDSTTLKVCLLITSAVCMN